MDDLKHNEADENIEKKFRRWALVFSLSVSLSLVARCFAITVVVVSVVVIIVDPCT